MADMGGGNFMVPENYEVKVLRLQTHIQERKSRIVRLNQDIEDLKEAAIKSKQAEVKMLELELSKLTDDLDKINSAGVVIDIESNQ
jgi:hypothetical protein